MNYMILARVIASISLIVATYIATVSIPCIDREISAKNEEIEKFKDHRVLGTISMLHADNLSLKKRIDLFEANLNSDRERQVALRKQALERTLTLTRNWTAFFTKGDKSDIFITTEKQLNSIVSDEQLTIEQQIEKTEMIMSKAFNDARARLEIAHEKRDEHMKEKEQLDSERSSLNSWFIRLQIFGLILIGFVEIFDKLKNKKIPNNSVQMNADQR